MSENTNYVKFPRDGPDASLAGHVVRLATLILVSLLGPGAALAQTSPLFTPLGTSLAEILIVDPDDRAFRSRHVAVDFHVLDEIRELPASKVELNVFPFRTLFAVIDQTVERAAGTFTLIGVIEGEPGSSVFLSVNHGVLAGEIRMAGGKHYQIRYVPGGVHEVREVDDAQYPACDGGLPAATGPTPEAEGAPLAGADDDGSLFDILVVYTPAARAAAGGTAAIEGVVNLAVDQTNAAYANSLITSRVRLVLQQEIAYTEVDTSTDLSRLSATADGHMDDVHALRDSVGADVVSLFYDANPGCGLAHRMTTLSPGFATSAFSVVKWSCATGNFSFGHELGHNLGSHHAVGDLGLVRGGSILFTYSYGWHFNSDLDRTIMATTQGTRQPYFSNPDVSFDGFPTGVPIGDPDEANNAQSINNAALTVANWRPEILPEPSANFLSLAALVALALVRASGPGIPEMSDFG